MNLNHLFNTQHADYERDLEPLFLGLDDCPFDNLTITADDNDITYTRPRNYCGFIDCRHAPTPTPPSVTSPPDEAGSPRGGTSP